MRKVLLYSSLLIAGLVVSQLLGDTGATPIRLLTMVALSFIMIHVGYEFELDKSQPGKYLWDYLVAGTAATFPWFFCTLYFVFVMAPRPLWGEGDLWRESLLLARFASPTSAGVLFAMLAAAGLGATWVFRRARVLAIFDDLDTILLMIPLKILLVGLKWQLLGVVAIIFALLWVAWRFLHAVRIPITWPWVLGYSTAITLIAEVIYLLSKQIDRSVPIHIEVLLPAFVLGCIMACPAGHAPHGDDAVEETEVGPESPTEQRVSTIISACFMVLVGLSMPTIVDGHKNIPEPDELRLFPPALSSRQQETVAPSPVLTYEGVAPEVLIQKYAFPSWGEIAVHVLLITVLSNLGKMFPLFCYRREATWRERLALSVAMFPRGEVGAGVLVIALSYQLTGPALIVAVLSLAVNLLGTGLFIVAVKRLIASAQPAADEARARLE